MVGRSLKSHRGPSDRPGPWSESGRVFECGHFIIAVVLSAVRLTAWADPAPSTQVAVTGRGVGISQMNGGTIHTGLTQEEVVALTKATGEELVRELTRILERSFAQQGWVYRQSVSIGVVEAFLANVKGRNIPQDEWPQVFRELTSQYLQFRSLERDTATAASTDMREAENKPVDGRSAILPDVHEELIIPAQDVETALLQLARWAGWCVFFDQRLAHVRSSAVHGWLEPEAAIAAMLAGTGLDYKFIRHNTISLFPKGSKYHSATDKETPEHTVPTSRDEQNKVVGPDDRHQLAGNSVTRGFSPSRDALVDLRQSRGDFCEEGMGDPRRVTRTNSTLGCWLDLRALGATASPVPFDGRRWPPGSPLAMYLDVGISPFSMIHSVPPT